MFHLLVLCVCYLAGGGQQGQLSSVTWVLEVERPLAGLSLGASTGRAILPAWPIDD